MKTGIYISEQDQKIGGGYIFEENILNALMRADSEHQFYIFSYNDLRVNHNKNIKHIILKKQIEEQTPKNPLTRFFHKKILKKKYPCIIEPGYSLNDAISEHNIEVIWFPALYNEDVKIPYIMTVWDLQHRLQPYFPEVSVNGWTHSMREAFYSKFLPKASYIITGNNTAMSHISRFYNIPQARIKIIPLFTPDFVLNDNTQQINIFDKLGISGVYLFYPAQFWPHKNHILLLKALKILNTEKGQNLFLVFTGTDRGNLNYIKEKTIELGLEEKVHFLGYVEQNELIQLYKNAFALVFPTYFGPDNIPPLEAMALKCPVISSNADGIEEQLGDCALYFNPDNEYELVEQVLKLLNTNALKTLLITKGYEMALNLTSDGYVKEFLEIIKEFKPIRETWSNKEKYTGI